MKEHTKKSDEKMSPTDETSSLNLSQAPISSSTNGSEFDSESELTDEELGGIAAGWLYRGRDGMWGKVWY